MPELFVALLHVPGEFVYAGTRAEGVSEAVAAFADEVSLEGIEWLQTYDSLPPSGQASDAVRAVLVALEDAEVAIVWAHADDEAPDPAEALKAHIEVWIDEAVERFGEFTLGDYAFVAQLRLDDDVSLGWAYQGSSLGAAALFTRAAEQARDGVDGSDG